MDWTVLLTPILLLPVGLFVLFVGCVFDGSSPLIYDSTFRVSFFLDSDKLGHSYEIRILDGGNPTGAGRRFHTDEVAILPGPGELVQADITFNELLVGTTLLLTCEVIDLGILPENISDPLPATELAVAEGTGCQVTIAPDQQYRLQFSAGVRADGTPADRFDPCVSAPI